MTDTLMNLTTVFMKRGQTITVWLGDGVGQVELRTGLDGRMEVFYGDDVVVQSFLRWYPIEETRIEKTRGEDES